MVQTVTLIHSCIVRPAIFTKLTLLMVSAILFPASGVADDLSIDLSETPIPFLRSEDLPPRVGAIIELGRGINEQGPLSEGIETPTGAVLQPALWIYGTQRAAALSIDGNRRTRPAGDRTELMIRTDFFFNLQLTGTERFQAHMRPLDKNGQFAGRVYKPDPAETNFRGEWDNDFETFFFEGDLGEMFPNMDPQDQKQGDIGIALGKFPVEFQDGYLVRDEIVALGVAKTNIQFPTSSGLRVAAIWGVDHINEANGVEDERSVDLFGVFTEGDFPWGLIEIDMAGTFSGESRGKQVNFGVGWTGHKAGRNYSIRANFSQHFDQKVDVENSINVRPNGQVKDYDGSLIAGGYSKEFNLNHDLVYATGFWAQGDFGRLASNGTPPLGPIGLSFAGVGLGGYRPALWPRPLDAVGGAVGIQRFFRDEKSNMVFELARRHDLKPDDEFGDTGGVALTARYQHKFANRFLLQVDAYAAKHDKDNRGPQDAETDSDSSAVRIEVRMNF